LRSKSFASVKFYRDQTDRGLGIFFRTPPKL
jgi:hypothetical protein